MVGCGISTSLPPLALTLYWGPNLQTGSEKFQELYVPRSGSKRQKMGERPHRRPQMSEGGGEDQTSHPMNMDSFIARTTRRREYHKTLGKPMEFEHSPAK